MSAHDKLNELYYDALHYARCKEQEWIEMDLEGSDKITYIALGESAAWTQLAWLLREEGYGGPENTDS